MKKILSILITLALLLPGIVCSSPAAGAVSLYPAVTVTSDGDRWGYIDPAGNFTISPVYVFAGEFNNNGIAAVAEGKTLYDTCKVYFIDTSGKTVSGPFTSTAPVSSSNGYFILRDGTGYAVVDEYGKVVLKSGFTLYEYQDGLIRYSQKTAGNKDLYGYMDISGKTVIPAKYQYADSFKYGRAAVTISEGNYAFIDRTGKVLQKSTEYLGTYANSEKFIAFRDKASGKSGYMTYDGKVAIPAVFNIVTAFEDGFAVTAVTRDYKDMYGVIDEKGNYVLEPEYSGIAYLGEGLFAVSQNPESFYYDNFSPKAIFDSKGTQLTDYIYYSVERFQNHLASACYETTTFFIGADGKKAPGYPELQGVGTMSMLGGVIKADIDGCLSYLKKDGSSIWTKDETIPLGGGITVKELKYRRDFCTFVRYPEVHGLVNAAVQANIDTRLKKLFTSGLGAGKDENGYAEDVSYGFSAERNKDLLIVEESGYVYPIGAAHGMPSETYYFIDLKTGVFYKLADLFRKDAKYTERLTSIVGRQIQLNLKTNRFAQNFYYFDEKPGVTSDQGFKIYKDCLAVYYAPYEIAAYAAGFPEFEIPYGQISDIIDTKGAFWNSFEKTVINSKTKIIGDIEKETADSINTVVGTYEGSMVDAVNGNNFGKVEGSLLKGSPLYNSQILLVQSLYRKKIAEKLVKYDIYAIAYDESKNEYKVFVNETVGVRYPGKNYVNNQYSWCYTAVYDSKTRKASLSRIEKW